MTLSPLINFAIESFELAIEQYQAGAEKNNRFCILLCDQAIELILKEKVRDLGESIFKGGGRTLDYFEATTLLMKNKGIKIPEFPDLELIHDLRNNIQHKGASVSKSQAEYYMKLGFAFIKRFLKDELNNDLKDLLDKKYYRIFEPEEEVQGYELVEVKEHVRVPTASKSEPISAILTEYRNLEIDMSTAMKKLGFHAKYTREMVKILSRQGYLDGKDLVLYQKLNSMRNTFAHTESVPSQADLDYFLDACRTIRNKIKPALE